MRLLIVEQDPACLVHLRNALRDADGVDLVGTARNDADALLEARRLRPDVLIVDASTAKLDITGTLGELRFPGGAQVIVLAASGQHAVAAFELEALDYLLKPVCPMRLSRSIHRAERRLSEVSALRALEISDGAGSETTIRIPDRSGCIDLPIASILWIEAARDYALFHTASRTHIKRVSMRELERSLPDTVLRVHRSAFVSLSEVRSLRRSSRDGWRVVLSDATPVPVGPSYLPSVRDALRPLRRGQPPISLGEP